MIKYTIGSLGQTLVLTDRVIKHLTRHRQVGTDDLEGGGQLFAQFDGSTVRVEQATGPRPSDRRSLMAFVPNRFAERREINRLFKRGLHFVGDWHTHAESYPRPSKTDIDSFMEMFRESRHKLAGFVMIIVGTAPPMEGLFVGLVNGESWQELQPLPVEKK